MYKVYKSKECKNCDFRIEVGSVEICLLHRVQIHSKIGMSCPKWRIAGEIHDDLCAYKEEFGYENIPDGSTEGKNA